MTDAKGSLSSLGDKFPVFREQYIMEALEWINSTGFRVFAGKFPEQAQWLQNASRNHTLLTRTILGGVGEVARNAMGVTDPNDIRVARIADFLTAAQNMMRLGSDGVANADQALQSALLSLPAETSTALIGKLSAMDPDMRARVVRKTVGLNPDQIGNLLSMDQVVLRQFLALGELPAEVREHSDPLLEGLQKAAEQLRRKAEEGGKG